MDIRQLHYFLTLCEEMNYTRAAQRLFLSRQALRQSISALEAEMCGPLFISAHHKLALTDRGMSLQRHAAPVVEQFQQMQAALRAEIQSAQPVRIGISVALVPDYLPGLETQLDKFRQQYPHVEMRFRLLDNDAVADGVEQGELDAGLVIDLGCAAPVLARTTLRADPACLLVPRGHPFWEKERIPLAELRGQRVLLPSLRQDLFSPLWAACARAGFAPNAEIGPSFYQAYYLVQEQLCTCLTRYEPGARRELDRVRDVLLEDMPPLCVSLVQRRDTSSAYIDLLRSYLLEVLGSTASLPPRRGRPAKPFYTAPVLSSAAAKAAPEQEKKPDAKKAKKKAPREKRSRGMSRGARTALAVGDAAISTVGDMVRFIVRIVRSVLLVLLLGGLLFACIFAYYVKNTLTTDLNITLEDYAISLSSTVWAYDNNGQTVELAVLATDENRIWVDYAELPPYLEKAAVAIEDKRFYDHKGVDWYRTAGAFVNMSLGMNIDFGGSTITLQLI